MTAASVTASAWTVLDVVQDAIDSVVFGNPYLVVLALAVVAMLVLVVRIGRGVRF